MKFIKNYIKTHPHDGTEIVPNSRTGHELRTPIGGGAYHSMISAGTCERTGYPVVIDQNKGRWPGFRRIEGYVPGKLDWGNAPSRSGLDVFYSARNEVYENSKK